MTSIVRWVSALSVAFVVACATVPSDYPKTPSHAFQDTGNTKLGRHAAQRARGLGPGESGFYVMTEGGPLHATDVIVYHIYQNAWQFLRMGYASAMSWVLFAVIFLITLLQFRLLGRRMAPS